MSWFLFYAVVMMLLVSSFLALLSMIGLEAQRHVSTAELSSGDHVQVTVTLSKPRLVPFFYYEVFDRLPAKVEGTNEGRFFFFSFAKTYSYTYEAQVLKRGGHSFRQIHVYGHDLFGLYRLRRKLRCESQVFAYPNYSFLNNLPSTFASSQLAKRSKKEQEAHSIAGLRSYAPGDRPTSIDWKRSAGGLGLMTKEFETDQSDRVVVINMPTDSSEHEFETAMSQTASIAATLVKGGIPLDLLIHHRQWHERSVETITWKRTLRALAEVEQATGEPGLPPAVASTIHGGIVFLVTPVLSTAVYDLCRTLASKRTQVVVYSAKEPSQVERHQMSQVGATLYVPSSRGGGIHA
ncbi:DUF58 domain-containing protein [Shouchella shacheensis]|uniref:DUF58 domain-containing protein n=1 Tax=Shouchella shacheensis TaxID=1649580 RepID=UPI0015D57EF2|nr:DUF58 domain-containing protein [Shouchella shacheensis]